MKMRLPAPAKSTIFLGSALALCAGAAGFLTPRAADGAVAPALQLLSRASAQDDADNVIFGSAVLRASLRAEVDRHFAAGEKSFVPASQKQSAEWANEVATVADAPEEASDFMQLGDDASGAFTVASNDVKAIAPPKKRGGLTILQIGDSHTAADYFTGEIRRLLQRRFGNGGPGYLEIGRPHPGVRSAIVNVAVSPGGAIRRCRSLTIRLAIISRASTRKRSAPARRSNSRRRSPSTTTASRSRPCPARNTARSRFRSMISRRRATA